MKKLVVLASAVALALMASPAFAHVSVTPKEASRSATVTLRFVVPNEEAPAATVKVEIFLPEGASFATVTPGTVDGWTASASDTSVTWSGGRITGEDRLEFPLTVGPIPSEGEQIVFKALQTYDNGEVVRWIDVSSGTAAPPHPAPVVKLVGAAPPTTTTAAAEDDDGGSSGPLILLAALFVAGVGGGIAIFNVVSRRRSA